MITLRPYQREALDAVYEYWHEGGGHPIVSVPTGGGKSLIIAQLIREALEWWPETRILCVTHVKELIAQNFSELLLLWPEAPVGIHSAGLNRRDVLSPVIFGGIQSLYKRARDLPRIDIVIVDEAHLIPRNSETMYRSFLAKLLELNPYLKVLGLTATPFRLDSGMLHEGDDALFSELVYEANVHDLIDQGYLVRPVSQAGAAQVDTDSVGTRGGEFIPGQLEAAALDPGTISAICDEINASGMGRTGWLVFACGIRHALLLRDELRARGVSCEAAFGDTPPDERKRIIEDFKARHTRCLVTVGILTTGFNARHVDLLACVRPTKSVGLWCQMIGRGLRLCPETGKEDCLVLDFGGNLARHGPIDNPIVRAPGAKDEDAKAPEKNCPECGAPNPIGARWCSECAAVFPTSERMVETKASKLSVLSNSAPEWLRVEEVHYYRHRKQGKPDSLRVQYRSGLNVYSEWICLEHGGFPREKAVQWWRRRAPEIPVPNSIDEALENTKHLEEPLEIAVRRTGKYFEIVGARL